MSDKFDTDYQTDALTSQKAQANRKIKAGVLGGIDGSISDAENMKKPLTEQRLPDINGAGMQGALAQKF
jgi:hypothetical protein